VNLVIRQSFIPAISSNSRLRRVGQQSEDSRLCLGYGVPGRADGRAATVQGHAGERALIGKFLMAGRPQWALDPVQGALG
jgi:hypothetical protein